MGSVVNYIEIFIKPSVIHNPQTSLKSKKVGNRDVPDVTHLHTPRKRDFRSDEDPLLISSRCLSKRDRANNCG